MTLGASTGQEFMRKEKGMVSISIPFLNSERFLAEAIESVLGQTYSRWELFLVDDGSTDRSTAIAKEYAARFPTESSTLSTRDISIAVCPLRGTSASEPAPATILLSLIRTMYGCRTNWNSKLH